MGEIAGALDGELENQAHYSSLHDVVDNSGATKLRAHQESLPSDWISTTLNTIFHAPKRPVEVHSVLNINHKLRQLDQKTPYLDFHDLPNLNPDKQGKI